MIFGSVTTSAQTREVEAAPNPAITPQTNPLVLRTLWGMTEEEVMKRYHPLQLYIFAGAVGHPRR
jgi:hypothetical protein